MSEKKRMTFLDYGFVRMERHEAPQHGSILVTFRIPDSAPADYTHRLAARMREYPVTGERFNWVLTKGLMAKARPAWTVVPPEDIDIDYHFRHSALPHPGGELELGLLVSRLVTHPVDLSRPPWEMHLIEGLQDNRFALLVKMHHSLVDGMTALRMLRSWLSDDPTSSDTPPQWAHEMPKKPSSRVTVPSGARPSSSVAEIAGAVRATIAAARGKSETALVAPYTGPRSAFNHPISQRRRVSTQVIELDRIKKVAADINGTLNDAIAVVFGGALRRYLLELEALPDRPLVAGMLASLRSTVDEGKSESTGNAISLIFADLATETDDVRDRADRVTTSSRAGKDHLLGLKGNAMAYSILVFAPYLLTTITGNGHLLPLYNVALSNVPGIDTPLYWNGAEAETLHATTVITNGQALVVTVISWNGKLCFTFTACPDTIPHPQRLSVYLSDALDEAEKALAR